MLAAETRTIYPSAHTLVNEKVASRLHAKDASLFGFSEQAR